MTARPTAPVSAEQRSIFDELPDTPVAGPPSPCCRQPLADASGGLWRCPSCARVFTLPTAKDNHRR